MDEEPRCSKHQNAEQLGVHTTSGRDCAVSGCVIFDGDDTLWATQILYEEAKEHFLGLIENLDFPADEVIARLEEIDIDRVATRGLSRSRFPGSLVRVYEELVRKRGLKVDHHLLELIFSVGDEVFSKPPKLYPDSIPTLEQLRPHMLLALYTKGDRQVQLTRVEQSGLGRFFDWIEISSDKDPTGYLQVLGHLDAASSRSWAVGNSVRSDVNPALIAGLRPILVVRNTWKHELAPMLPGEVHVVNSLSKAANIILARSFRD